MKLNRIANNIRNLDIGLSSDRALDAELKQEIIAILKTKHSYAKDIAVADMKRERRTKIRDLAGNDPAKIISLKEQLYADDEKATETLSRYPGHKGYSALYEQYGKDERYHTFFSKLRVEGNNIILDHKKFAILTAKHNGKNIFAGDFERKGQKGIAGLTYMTGNAGMEQAEKQ